VDAKCTGLLQGAATGSDSFYVLEKVSTFLLPACMCLIDAVPTEGETLVHNAVLGEKSD
jgi:hypothetical protein